MLSYNYNENDFETMVYGTNFSSLKENYQKILATYKNVSEELNIKSALELSYLFTILLWNGYFSETKENIYSTKNRLFLNKPFEIMCGYGACFEQAKLLRDYLEICNKKATIIGCSYGRSIFLNSLKSVNHAVVLEEENNKVFIYDPTNIEVSNIKNTFIAVIINGTGKIYFKNKNNPIDRLPNSIYKKKIEPAFTKGEVISCEEKINELLNINRSLIDDYYNSIYSSLEIIKNEVEKILIRKKYQ